jgi:hypothetical protein
LSDVRRSVVCGCSSFCSLTVRLLGFVFLASLRGEPFWESLFQHQSPRRELLLVCSAYCASPFSRGMCVCSQRGDERVEDILKERDHRRSIGIVVRESDLETEDGIGIRA